MNIYMVVEDGESFCIRAFTMSEAVEICEKSYLEDREAEEATNFDKEHETKYYHAEIIQSCSLVATLRN